MTTKIAVVIPCYKVRSHIEDVLRRIPELVERIYVVDDKCPESTGDFVEQSTKDPRVKVLRNEKNLGVGGAVMTGYRAALDEGLDIVVKVDGDNQMDPRLIPQFVAPILAGEADYTKGNRFYTLYSVRSMPTTRALGNLMLGFLTKLSSGYWSIFDPTNGYTAIHCRALKVLDLKQVSERYFFESDMLIMLGGIRAVVVDVPMEAVYGTEVSNLKISRILGEFFHKHARAILRRITYLYFLRDFNLASINLLFGAPLFLFGLFEGVWAWWSSADSGVPATAGTVMLAVLPIVLGFQMMLFFLSYDVANEPKRPIQRRFQA